MYSIIADVPLMRRKRFTFVVDGEGHLRFSAPTATAAFRWLIEEGHNQAMWIGEDYTLLLHMTRSEE